MTGHLLTLGHGYSASHLSRALAGNGWRITGITRDPGKFAEIRDSGAEPALWADAGDLIGTASHILVSAAPDSGGDPVLAAFAPQMAAAKDLIWLGYLSTTAVYGDHRGGAVDEHTPLTPGSPRGAARVLAEGAWRDMADRNRLPLHIFRLAGIYGPGRGPGEKLRQGTARRIVRPGQIFSRIHADDIAQALAASMARPDPGLVVNLCDDEAAPPEDVIAYAAQLMGLPVPVAVPFDTADMSPEARSFYSESKQVLNARMKACLGIALKYPTYREGLAALTTSGDGGVHPRSSA